MRAAYSADAVYLYSIHDDPEEGRARPSSVLKPHNAEKNHRGTPARTSTEFFVSPEDLHSPNHDPLAVASSIAQSLWQGEAHEDDFILSDEEEESEEYDEEEAKFLLELDEKFKTPVIMPRRKFTGHCNVETVKDGSRRALVYLKSN